MSGNQLIRRIELHNLATHENTEIELDKGKNVIIGATGSGKTNLLLAIDFAFTGEVPGINLSELIADDADAAEVILDYIEPRTGQNYRIHRNLTRETTDRVKHECVFINLETNEVVKKPTSVQTTLENLGVIPSVFRNVIHVAQGKAADLLDETQERKNILDRLFHIAQLENAHQELGRQSGPIHQIEQRKHQNLETKSRLEVAASKLSEEKTTFSRLKKEWQSKQSRLDELRKEYEKLEKISKQNSTLQQTLQEVDKQIQTLKETTVLCTNQIKTILSQLYRSFSKNNSNKIENSTAKETLQYLQAIKKKYETLKAKENKLKRSHKQAIEKYSVAKSQANLIKTERLNKSNQLSGIRNYLNGKGEQPKIECDKCGSILTKEQWKKHLEEERVVIETLNNKIDDIQKQAKNEKRLKDKLEEKLEENTVTISKLEKIILLIEQLVAQRKNLEEVSTSITPKLEKKNSLLTELRQLLKVDSTIEDEEVIKTSLLLNDSIANLSTNMQDLTNDLKSYDENHIKPQQKRVNEAEQATEQLKKIEPEINLDEKKITLLHTIRNSLRDIQPAVRKNYVSRITQSANDYLKRLYGGKEIKSFELTEDYQFLVTRAGHKRHANRLSGGQQVLASMAFLLALSEVLSQLDFLILDEPTTHLDANRRKELVTVLEKLRRVPQLIIVDHHPELLEAADMSFHVSLTSEGTSQINPN